MRSRTSLYIWRAHLSSDQWQCFCP